jgi:predicted HTH transcriptional regulator
MTEIIFPDRESKLLEFKSRVTDFLPLIKTSIAFANAAGGRIIIGVDDKTRAIIGATGNDRIRIQDDFPNSLYDSVAPNIIPQIYERNFADKIVIVIEIPASPRKPYFLKSVGTANGTYVRVGSSTRKANQEYIEDLIREAQRITFDEENLHQSKDVLSQELLRQLYGKNVTQNRLLADKVLTQQIANKELIAPTVAGILMFTEQPHNYLPEALIRCTQFRGTEGRDIIRTEEIIGNINQQSITTMNLLKAWLATDYKLQGVQLMGQLPVPETALREAIFNALLHRKYTIPGAIKIAVFEDRLEVFSPGCFPGLVDINNLGDGITYLRNPILVRLAHRMHLVETLGSGIRLMFESCYKAGIRAPEFHEEGDFVKVVFYFQPDIEQHKSNYESIILILQKSKQTTAAEIANYLKVSHNTAIRKLNQLVKEKRLIKFGKGPAVRYKLNR